MRPSHNICQKFSTEVAPPEKRQPIPMTAIPSISVGTDVVGRPGMVYGVEDKFGVRLQRRDVVEYYSRCRAFRLVPVLIAMEVVMTPGR